MREIKFRGKNDNGTWLYGGYYSPKPTVCFIAVDNDFAHRVLRDVIPETVGQYIQTVNHHRIFTGDIVKAYKHGDTESKPFIYEITERVGTYWFGNWTWLEFLNIFRYVEVIGNSTDKPELLEVLND